MRLDALQLRDFRNYSEISLNFDPEGGTNPLLASSSANMQFWGLLYDSVFTVDENLRHAHTF